MKKILLTLAVLATALTASAENYILYTSTDGKVVNPNNIYAFGANIISNTYDNGQGMIFFDGEVTMIGERAFCYDCWRLSSIEIPNSVTEIGFYAFGFCYNLASVKIPNSVKFIGFCAFQDCSSLTSVEIPTSVTEIGAHAFENCTSLTSVEIPNSVNWIGDHAFENCSSLTSVKIPNYITEIGLCVFRGCSSLKTVDIPYYVSKIGVCAFDGCSSLTSVKIANTVTSIGAGAFEGCSSLTSIDFPNSIYSIENDAFKGCSSLKSVTIPYSVSLIGDAAFANCNSLESFFGKFASDDNRFLNVDGVLNSFAPSGLNSYEIPSSVTKIGESAFEGCTGLNSIVIPNSVTSIGWRAFLGCTNLESFYCQFASDDNRLLIIDGETKAFAPAGLDSYEIPSSVTKIGSYSFYGCSGLKSVVIPSSVTELQYHAFVYCSDLEDITSLAVIPPYSSSSVFDAERFSESYSAFDFSKVILYVPDEAVDAYKADWNWNFFPNIVGIVFQGIEEIHNLDYRLQESYGLSGQPVGAEYRGIVIENGKKVIKR